MFRLTLSLLLYFLFMVVAKAQSQPSLIPYEDNGVWGYCNAKGIVKIKPQWKKANFFNNGKAIVAYATDGKEKIFCLINSKGKYIIAPERHWNGEWNGWEKTALNTHDDNGNWGLTDLNNHTIIPIQYQLCNSSNTLSAKNPWHKPALAIKKGDKVGVIDTLGNVLIPFIYEEINIAQLQYLDSNYIVVKKDGKFGIVNAGHNNLLPCKYDELFTNADDKWGLKVKENGKYGYLTTNLLPKLPSEFQFLLSTDSFIIAAKDYKFGIYDRQAKERIPFIYANICLNNGMIEVTKTVMEHPADDDEIRVLVQADTGKQKALVQQNYEQLLRARDLHPLTDWAKRRFLPQEDWCGFGRHQAAMYEARKERYDDTRPKLVINGKTVVEFVKDSISWATENYSLFHGSQIVVSGSNGNDKYSAIIDAQLNYLVKPVKLPLKLISFNSRDSLITAFKEENGVISYGVLDKNLKIVLPFQPKQIVYGFKWKNKVYADVLDCNCPIDEGNPYRYDFREEKMVWPDLGAQRIISTDGQIVKALVPYPFFRLADEFGRNSWDYIYPCIVTKNEHDLVGLVTVEGKTLYPDVSFKYKYMQGFGDGFFMVQKDLDPKPTTGFGYEYIFVNANGEKLFPKCTIIKFEAAPVPSLYYVECVDKNNKNRAFYMNKDGFAYTNGSLE